MSLYTGITVTCPVKSRYPDDIVGCGATFEQEPDDEGFFDCPNCGLFFKEEAQDPPTEQLT